MVDHLTAADLETFESQIAELFNSGQIRAPIHLADGNEDELIAIFANIREQDWVFCSWRSHYHCLLKGVSPEILREEILSGRSISLCFPDQRIYSSAIVGGSIPIAVGVAMGIARHDMPEHVWCFIGDMTAEMGMATSAIKFASQMKLPITFIVEDNGLSVMTPTQLVWGKEGAHVQPPTVENVIRYQYRSKYPHAGAGVRVEF